MGGFPSGQRGQTVNLLQFASVVRIHLRPLMRGRKDSAERVCFSQKPYEHLLPQWRNWQTPGT